MTHKVEAYRVVDGIEDPNPIFSTIVDAGNPIEALDMTEDLIGEKDSNLTIYINGEKI
jgi:hypothetical protein|tara:strand:- start:323 stop:496 length:174 start_codon:yes stop_codon:yes gene_type:complete